MGINFIYGFVLALLLSCSNSLRQTQDSSFQTFLTKFNNIQMPFKIFEGDLHNYSDSVFNQDANVVSNPLLNLISGNDKNLLKSKYEFDKSKFYSLYKQQVGEYHLLFLTELDNQGTGMWIKLAVFDHSGEIQDTLTFAGQKEYEYNINGEIDQNYIINTTAYHDVQQYGDRQDLYTAIEIINEYQLTEQGRFNNIKSQREQICFLFRASDNYKKRIIGCPQ